jgi:hypothetical protein
MLRPGSAATVSLLSRDELGYLGKYQQTLALPSTACRVAPDCATVAPRRHAGVRGAAAAVPMGIGASDANLWRSRRDEEVPLCDKDVEERNRSAWQSRRSAVRLASKPDAPPATARPHPLLAAHQPTDLHSLYLDRSKASSR